MGTFRRLLILLVAVVLIAAACGSDDGSDDSADDSSAAGSADSDSSGDADEREGDAGEGDEEEPAESSGGSTAGLEVARVDLTTGTAQIINTGDAPVDLSGLWICNRPAYSELPPVEIAPSEGIEVQVGGVSEGGGEVAIYSSDNFDNSDDMISYVQWGGGGGRAAVAEAAGVWSGAPVEPSGTAIALVGEPGTADGWE